MGIDKTGQHPVSGYVDVLSGIRQAWRGRAHSLNLGIAHDHCHISQRLDGEAIDHVRMFKDQNRTGLRTYCATEGQRDAENDQGSNRPTPAPELAILFSLLLI